MFLLQAPTRLHGSIMQKATLTTLFLNCSWSTGHSVNKPLQSSAAHREDPVSIPGQLMCDLCRTRLFRSGYFTNASVLASQLSFNQCSIFVFIHLPLTMHCVVQDTNGIIK
jgi:hypothetical protein